MSIQVINTLTDVYNLFNVEFFDNKLTSCVITLGKKSKAYGVYMPNRWVDKYESLNKLPEIKLVSNTFKDRSTKEILSTLLHEQVHHWRSTLCDKKKTNRAHDKWWAKKMNEVGLKPYNVKDPLKETGTHCSHKIIEGGLFDIFVSNLIDNGIDIKYYFEEKPKRPYTFKRKKVTYTCSCGNSIKSFAGLNIKCCDCDTNFVESI